MTGGRSYDDHQLAAVWISWLCCRRTVIATNPNLGCFTCGKR
jgi:DNA-directed RNA polymerase subunit N (RpoN/RPB10)